MSIRTIAFNKPYGVLPCFTDPEGRPTLADYVSIPDVYAAGRLDQDSEGLMILTSDGNLAHRITDPQHKLPKHVPTAWLEIAIHEGMNRQVRRMTAAVGHPTLRLVRIAIGAVRLGDLKPGEWRDLQEDDIPPLRSRPSVSRRDA